MKVPQLLEQGHSSVLCPQAVFRVTGKASEVQAQDCEHHSASCEKYMEMWCMGAIAVAGFEEEE